MEGQGDRTSTRITDEMIEAGARALWADRIEKAHGESAEEYLTWSTINREPDQEDHDLARLVLQAALDV